MYMNCPACKLLWDDLSDATKAYFAILSKSEIAQIEHNSALIKDLEPLKLAATERRGNARKALREREATHPVANGQTA